MTWTAGLAYDAGILLFWLAVVSIVAILVHEIVHDLFDIWEAGVWM